MLSGVPPTPTWNHKIRVLAESKLYKSNIIYDADRRLGAAYLMYYNATGDSQAGKVVLGSERMLTPK